MIINAMSIDVEDYYQVENFKDVIKKNFWGKFESRVEKNTYKIIETLDIFQLKATFFILGWIAEREKNLIKTIHESNHEVASHGYSHDLIYCQTHKHFREDIRKSKRILEDIIGEEVIGYRAPSYSITKKSLWSIDILIEEGFKYDSSIFPTIHDRYGIADAKRFPYKLQNTNENFLDEFPPSTFRFLGKNIPISGGGYFRFFPYRFTKWAFTQINKRENKPFIFYIHPWEFDQNQPKIKANKLLMLRHYYGIDKTEKRFMRLLNDFKFDTIRNVLKSTLNTAY
jgi:polysaccharide deacetylase family protein (PEP-CTERM system associated)